MDQRSNEILIVEGCKGGYRPPMSLATDVPSFCLYDDGRAIYTEFYSEYQCRLMEGMFSDEKVREILSAIEESGFFDLKGYYFYLLDAPTTYIVVRYPKFKRVDVVGIGEIDEDSPFKKVLSILKSRPPSSKPFLSDRVSLYVRYLREEKEIHYEDRIKDWHMGLKLEDMASKKKTRGGALIEGEKAVEVQNYLDGLVPYSYTDLLGTLFREKNKIYELCFKPYIPGLEGTPGLEGIPGYSP